MKKKTPIIVEEYATMKDMYLAEKGTLEGYEAMMTRIGQQLQEVTTKRTRPDGTIEPWPEPEPMVVEEVVEYETLKEDYLAEKGTLVGYEEMLADIGRQMRDYAARGYRIVMKGDRVLRIEGPTTAKKKPRKNKRKPGNKK